MARSSSVNWSSNRNTSSQAKPCAATWSDLAATADFDGVMVFLLKRSWRGSMWKKQAKTCACLLLSLPQSYRFDLMAIIIAEYNNGNTAGVGRRSTRGDNREGSVWSIFSSS